MKPIKEDRKKDSEVISKILRLLKPYRGRILFVVICIIISSAISMFLPLISQQIMDEGLINRNMPLLVQFSLLSLFLVLVEQGIGLIETRSRVHVYAMMTYNMHKESLRHIMKLKSAFFTKSSPTELMSNLYADIGNISKISDRNVFYIISSAFKMLGGIIGLLLIDWRLTLIILFIIPIRYILVRYLTKQKMHYFEENMRYNAEYSNWFGDTMEGVQEIKIWGLERIRMGQFIKKWRNIIRANTASTMLDKANELSEVVLFFFINSLLTIVGAIIVFNNMLSIGGLFAFITYSNYVTGPISMMLNMRYTFSGIIPSARRYFDFMEQEPEEERIVNPSEQKEPSKGSILFENVSFSYQPDQTVLKNLNFEVKEGEKTAIIGTNGSGKSTLMQLLLKLYEPNKGRILIGSKDIREMDPKKLRKRLSAVSQKFYLFDTSIKDNITLFSTLPDGRIAAAIEVNNAQEFVQSLPGGLQHPIGRNGARLSGGQRQKIAVIRALVKDADIVLLDEATSHYDAASIHKFNESLHTLLKDKTVILVTHHAEVLSKMDRIIILDNGCVADMGKHNELYERNPYYRNILERSNAG